MSAPVDELSPVGDQDAVEPRESAGPVARPGLGAVSIIAAVALSVGAIGGVLLTRGGDDEPVRSIDAAALMAGLGHQHGSSTNDSTAGSTADGAADSARTVERPTIVEFGGSERARLGEQLETARTVALRYPTYADALDAGYVPTTPYAPGTGSHLGKPSDTQLPGAELDVRRPQSYLYDGTDPDSRVVGLMYVQIGGSEAPEGFAGPLDRWDPFRGQCLAADTMDPLFPGASSVSEAQCSAAGGDYLDITVWTQHVWVVPGWEAPGGVFAHFNDDLVCADGTGESDPVTGCAAPTHDD